jgi:polyhydroxyalkanoate synthase
MEEIKEFNFLNLFKRLTDANNKIIQNYFENFSAYHHDNRDIVLTYFDFFSKLAINPHEIFKIQNFCVDAFQQQLKIWNDTFIYSQDTKNPSVVDSQKSDPRFLAKEWTDYPYFNFLKQNYLLIEKLSKKIIDEVEIEEKTHKRLGFYNEQYLDALSPSNFLITNPEVLKLAFETKGNSLWDGFNNLVNDIEKGKITQSDESAFEIGKNLAISPGAVIYENDLIQLIQYSPSTKKVNEIPLLIVPPWINKFYILDLQPENSFVKFMVDKGITVYMISWRNPSPGMGDLTFDDYVKEGALKAIEVVQEISSVKKINVLGYCLGGTLLSVAVAILSNDKKSNPINTATFLASMIDFSYIGPMGDVINESLIKKLERGDLLKDGIMHGHDMERAFNLIRANDLVWKYVVNNYLKGLKPNAFDVLYWTNDNTNLPAKMYVYYMRNMIFENKLSRKNALTICNTPIDIGKIEFPVFVVGFSKDYISPAKTAFTTTELVSGPVEFILGESGHVMGAINAPSKNKYGYYLNGKLGGSFEDWKKTAKFFSGSWWTPWSERLLENSGKQISSPEKPGNEKYKIIEPAPGKYVKEKYHESIKKTVKINLNKIISPVYEVSNN